MGTFHLRSPLIRDNAIQAVRQADEGDIVTIKKATRSNQANAKMWCMLSDISRAKVNGRNWTPETYKAAFMHSIGHQVMFAEGLDGSGPFPLGFRSSALSVAQMSDLITVMYKFGDENGVDWKETKKSGFWDLQERTGS